MIERHLPANLREVGLQLARCYCLEESRALRRPVSAEAPRFPDLLDVMDEVSHRVTQALTDRLARLSLAARLLIDDPELAAAQFTAPLTGSVDTRSRLATRSVPDAGLQAITEAAVATFLKAFGK